MQKLVEFTKTTKRLVISLTDAGDEETLDNPDIDMYDLFEYQLCNGWEIILPEEIGALTSCELILSDSVERDDEGKLIKYGKVYWFPGYALEDPINTLMENGAIVLDEGE